MAPNTKKEESVEESLLMEEIEEGEVEHTEEMERRQAETEEEEEAQEVAPGTVWMLRHAQSTHNASKGLIDVYDADITPLGEQQASKVSGHFDLVLVSPMRRTRRTLECSRITYTHRVHVEEAREWIGTRSDLLEGESEALCQEPLAQWHARIISLREMLRSMATSGKRVLLVAHYYTIQYLTSDVELDEWGKVVGSKDTGTVPDNAQLLQFQL